MTAKLKTPSHGLTVTVTERDAETSHATKCVGKCDCGDAFVGASYAIVEDGWREHVWKLTGKAPEAWGSKDKPRWAPPGDAS